jgi:leader peptidase (prepilin peptidase) / N-methyltransferase
LIIGSFLNVVIYRLPMMMEREWRKDCREFLNLNRKRTPLNRFQFNFAALALSALPNRD